MEKKGTVHGPIDTKLSELSLLDDSISNQQETPTYSLQSINSTHAMLDSGRGIERGIEQHCNFSYQVLLTL